LINKTNATLVAIFASFLTGISISSGFAAGINALLKISVIASSAGWLFVYHRMFFILVIAMIGYLCIAIGFSTTTAMMKLLNARLRRFAEKRRLARMPLFYILRIENLIWIFDAADYPNGYGMLFSNWTLHNRISIGNIPYLFRGCRLEELEQDRIPRFFNPIFPEEVIDHVSRRRDHHDPPAFLFLQSAIC
jgi:hypothetical protein